MADAQCRSDLPSNRTTGSMLLTALALSDDNLLSILRDSQVLQRVELSLHSCKMFTVHDEAWILASRALHDLQLVLTSIAPVALSMIEPYAYERVIRICRELGAGISLMQGQLG
jgi:hypothetical protein